MEKKGGFLSSSIFKPLGPTPHVLFNKKPSEATVSPIHLVCMHGLLGNRKHFHSLCNTISGANTLPQIELEAKKTTLVYPPVRWMDSSVHPKFTTPGLISSAPVARVYPSAAFDWRNHGDSFHDPVMNLDTLSTDLDNYLHDYVTQFQYSTLPEIRSPEDLARLPPPVTPKEPLPIVLIAHSMGAMALIHWLWNGHIKSWEQSVLAESLLRKGVKPDFDPKVTAFSNPFYKVLGAVVLDMAPSRRPQSFNDTIKMIEFLPFVPVEQFKNAKEAETWLLKNGPQAVFNQHNIWQIRFHLSNIDFSQVPSGGKAAWKTGLQEIIRSLHTILWEEGGMQCLINARHGLQLKNAMNISDSKDIWELPPRVQTVPTFFIFGEQSSYCTESAFRSIFKRFKSPYVAEVVDSDHFFFMKRKNACKKLLADFLYVLEKENNLL